MSKVSPLMEPASLQDMEAKADKTHEIRLAGKILESIGFTKLQIPRILEVDGVPEQVCSLQLLGIIEKLQGQLARLNMTKDIVSTAEGIPSVELSVIQQESNKATLVQRGERFLQKDEILAYPGLSIIFQEKINTLVNEGASTWQQRMDAIITLWNRQHRDAQVYKYIQYGDGKKAGDSWKEVYKIECSLDFQTLFGVTFPDWMQAKKKGRKLSNGSPVAGNLPEPKTDDSTEPTQAVGAGFPGFVTQGALEAHAHLNGKKVKVNDKSRPMNTTPTSIPVRVQSQPIVKPVPIVNATSQRSLQILKPPAPLVEITDKKERKEFACNVFNQLLIDALAKYAKGKMLTWKTSQFTGIPDVASGHLRTEFSENSTTLMIQGCHDEEVDIWNAFQANGFIDIMKRDSRISYHNGEHKYTFKTETGIIILVLPAQIQRKKVVQNNQDSGPIVYASSERMDAMKDDFHQSIDAYLNWYYRVFNLKEEGIAPTDFLIERLPIQFRNRKEADIFIIEGSFSGGADFGTPVRKQLLEALHDVPVIKRFLVNNIGGQRFILDTKKGEKQNITFFLEGKDRASRVIFHPYLLN